MRRKCEDVTTYRTGLMRKQFVLDFVDLNYYDYISLLIQGSHLCSLNHFAVNV